MDQDKAQVGRRSKYSKQSPTIDTTNNSNNPPSHTKQKVRLERNLGVWNGVAIIIGVIVGSGIFLSPTGVFKYSGSIGLSLCVWALCGLLALMGALCMAELGTSIPDSGGEYTYIRMAYGNCMSFLYLWVTMLIILPCSNAVAALTFANYVLKPFWHECEPPSQVIRLLALGLIMILIWINCYSVKWSIKLQNAFTLTKVLALVLIITMGLFTILKGESKISAENLWKPTDPKQPISLPMLATAVYSGLFSYAGWNALNFVTEEIKNPPKNMPRATIISITTITLIYILVNISYFAVLRKDQMSDESPALAVTFGKETMGVASFVMPLSVALSTTSGLNALIFSSSRILFVGARQGQLPCLLNMISVKRLTPTPSLIFVGFMSMLYLITTEIQSLLHYLVFIEAGFGTLGVSTLLVLRHKQPNLVRPLRVHTYIPVIYLIMSTVLLLMPIVEKPTELLVGIGILLTGVPVYFLTSRNHDSVAYRKTSKFISDVTQKLTLSVLPEEDGITDRMSQSSTEDEPEALKGHA